MIPENAKFYDITPLISEKLAVFPGDIAYKRAVSMDTTKGDHIGLSAITTTVHLGAHTDAENHYHKNGNGIDAKNLSIYIGPAQVIEVQIARGERIKPEHIKEKITAARVLFKTNSFPDPNNWNSDFNSLSPELIELLAKFQVKLVGIDTPSIDPSDSKKLESHAAIYKNSISVLEGIILDQVIPGLYTLVALPLKLKDADASPVRAILLR